MAEVEHELWDEFHRVVNMASPELRDFLATEGAGEDAEAFPDQSGSPVGHEVLAVLGKRRTDLTPRDAEVMAAVVDLVHREHPDEERPVEDARLRHRLMGVGHDPLRAASS